MSTTLEQSIAAPETRSPPDTGTAKRLGLWATVAVVLMYLASISPQWYIGRDSAVYLLLGESLARGEGYAVYGRPHTHMPPGYPLMLATMMRVGLGEMLWLNLAMIVTALAALWLAYQMLREQVPQTMALIVALTVAVTFEMHHLAIRQLSDVPFMALVCGGLWCYLRGLKGRGFWLEAGTLALVASCWVRVVGFPLALGAVAGLLLQGRGTRTRRVWGNALAVVLGLGVTVAIFYAHYRGVQGPLPPSSYAHHFTKMADRSPYAWLWMPVEHFLETGRELARLFTGQTAPVGIALVAFWLPSLFGMSLAFRRRQYVGVGATAGYLGAIVMLRPMLARYLLPVLPLLLVYFFEGVRRLLELAPRLRAGAPHAAVGAALLFAAFNLPKDLRSVYRLHHPRSVEFHDSWPPLLAASDYLRETAREDDVLLANADGGMLSYLSRVPYFGISKFLATHDVTPEQVLRILGEQGISLLVFRRDEDRPHFQTLSQLVQENRRFELVFENEVYQIYRRTAETFSARRVHRRV